MTGGKWWRDWCCVCEREREREYVCECVCACECGRVRCVVCVIYVHVCGPPYIELGTCSVEFRWPFYGDSCSS